MDWTSWVLLGLRFTNVGFGRMECLLYDVAQGYGHENTTNMNYLIAKPLHSRYSMYYPPTSKQSTLLFLCDMYSTSSHV
jgi:hypothetical protein